MRDQEQWWMAQAGGEQLTFADLGQPLSDTTFMAVDLETTGTGKDSEITEIGAVKVRGGEVIGEFQTLVKPETSVITPYVSMLTGITNSMVHEAPPLAASLPSFLEFARGAVWVAHNAPFDVGFLRRACTALDHRWPSPTVLDTVTISRSVLGRDEVRNHKLSSLAAHFGASTTPDHRALSDARATIDVLHGLIARLGSQGVFSLEELRAVTAKVSPKQRSRHRLAEGLPSTPGVYLFLDQQRRPLYIGTSVNIRSRVKQYFTAAETRSRMGEMVQIAQEVRAITCSTPLEAAVRELRLIAEHKPPYNRRSKFPERAPWLVLTAEAFPRLSISRTAPAAGTTVLGGFGSHRSASKAKRALEQLTPVRVCGGRIPARDPSSHVPCAAGALGRCGGPCQGILDPEEYRDQLSVLDALSRGDGHEVWASAAERMRRLGEQERFEEAADLRDGAVWAIESARSTVLRGRLRDVAEIIATAPSTRAGGGWDIAVIRGGRLAAASHAPDRHGVRGAATAAALLAEVPEEGAAESVITAETTLVERWLSEPGVRLLEVTGAWALPTAAAPVIGLPRGSGDGDRVTGSTSSTERPT